jgi:carboxypeptidase C (cathepsin A)
MFKWLFLFFVVQMGLYAENASPSTQQCQIVETFSETNHTVNIQGKPLNYKATAGNLILKDCQDKETASIFFVSYTKDEGANKTDRPITFCFNGGPGSASIWLNIGIFGPRIVKLSSENALVPPYHLVDNPESILDLTDLVFIDAVSAGHSIAAPNVDPKNFHGTQEDAKAFAQFIRLYLTRYKRWNSPKYIAGESYGTTRAGTLSHILQEDYGIYLNGVILVSAIMDFQTKSFAGINDLAYMLTLPTYTAIAWYHKKLPNNNLELPDVLAEAEEFALNQYALALLRGDNLSQEERSKIALKLAQLTGLSEQYIDLANLRIHPTRFAKELLRNEKKIVGRFDGRYSSYEMDSCNDGTNSDPSFEALIGPFTAIFNNYLSTELKWSNENQYTVLANVQPWNWGKSNQYLNTSDDLAQTLQLNPNLKVFVASGYYDLATPYFATVFTFDHLGLNQALRDRLFMYEYEGGHMMYTSQSIINKMRKDLEYFYKTK